MSIEEFDVAIGGAGMVGLAAAGLLVKQGYRVLVFDKAPAAVWQTAQASPRVSALNIASVNLFKYLGVWHDIEKIGITPYSRMAVWQHQQADGIDFDSLEFGQPWLGAIVENNNVIQAIQSKLSNNDWFDYRERTEAVILSDHSDRIEVQTGQNYLFHCNLLIGADGAQSGIRKLARIDSQRYEYAQDAIVTTVKLERSHQHTAWQSFTQSGPIALLPYQQKQGSIVWSCDQDKVEQLMALDESDFCERLTAYFGHKTGPIVGSEKRLRFALKQHHADTYIANKIALVGDAAHSTHPLAGLGANIGLLDAAALAEVIDDSRNLKLSIAQKSVLRRYERWRRGENALVLHSMKAFKNIFASPAAAIQHARQSGLRIANSVAPLKQQFAEYAMGISGDIPKACR